jgi:phenylacetaldehyde dehydrogenase
MATATASAVPTPLASVRSFLSEKHGLLIGGRFAPSADGRTFSVENPAQERPIAQVAQGGAVDIDRAVAAARKAFEQGPWRRMNPSERQRLLWKLAERIEELGEEFAQIESLDNGKPLTIARAADVALTVDHFR